MSRELQAKAIRNSIIKMAKSDASLDANEIRVILSLERIVARLSNDPKLARHLVYKGGFVLLKTLNSKRFTRDLDALGLGKSWNSVKLAGEDMSFEDAWGLLLRHLKKFDQSLRS